MNTISLVELNNNENIINDNVINDDKLVGLDIISKIEIELKNDVLLKLLKESNLYHEIVTDSMKDLLKENTQYSTTAISRMISVPNSTLRGWITELEDYINPVFSGETYKLLPKSIYKLRMIQLLRKNLRYSISYIKSITIGTNIIDGNKNSEKSINEKVEELIKENENMKKIIMKMAKNVDATRKVMMELIDNDVYKNNGKILLNSKMLTNLLEVNKNPNLDEKIENSIKSIKEELNDVVKQKIDEALRELNLNKKLNNNDQVKDVSISTEEIKEYSKKLKHKTIWDRLFRIKNKR